LLVKVISILSIGTMAAMTAGFVNTELGGSMAGSGGILQYWKKIGPVPFH